MMKPVSRRTDIRALICLGVLIVVGCIGAQFMATLAALFVGLVAAGVAWLVTGLIPGAKSE